MRRSGNADADGEAGELRAAYVLGLVGADGTRPFRSRAMGAKTPGHDLFVELLDGGLVVGCFVVQVKATRSAVNGRGRLPVSLRAGDLPAMRHVLPSYVVGVHLPSQACYVAETPAPGAAPVSTMPTRNRLDVPETRDALCRAVRRRWRTGPGGPFGDEFRYGD